MPSAWRRQPWKNGRGFTSEVLLIPEGADDYWLRVSVAEVSESAPFSTFPGFRRWSLLLEGFIWLDNTRMAQGELVELETNREIAARVDAPARLLNIIGKGISVGQGAASDVRVVFELETRETRVFDVPRNVSHGVWIKWCDQ
jgi:environmental stress-induced protein Ves